MGQSHLFLTEEHEAFRQQVRRFVEKEIVPNIDRWEREGQLPRDLHRKAAQAGILQVGYPEQYGGIEVPDLFFSMVRTEEFARAGSGGVLASLFTHNIGSPPVLHTGSEEQKQRFLVPVLAGDKIAALAITEPNGGSDVANLKTKAVRDGDDYIVNGSKIFITSGMRADFITTAVRTGGEGMGGVSLLVIEGDTPGLSRTAMEKMGWHCSDTAALYFDNVRVPAANRLGPENQGFKAIMRNFNSERIGIATQAVAFAQTCYDEALAYAKERETFGRLLIKNQVIRHKLVDMIMRIEAARANLQLLALRVQRGDTPVAEVCMLKVFATNTLEWVVNEAVQILGGAGYALGSCTERIYREAKVLAIGGGSQEIMKELAGKQLGY